MLCTNMFLHGYVAILNRLPLSPFHTLHTTIHHNIQHLRTKMITHAHTCLRTKMITHAHTCTHMHIHVHTTLYTLLKLSHVHQAHTPLRIKKNHLQQLHLVPSCILSLPQTLNRAWWRRSSISRRRRRRTLSVDTTFFRWAICGKRLGKVDVQRSDERFQIVCFRDFFFRGTF